jgi:hypothetical protein
MKQWRRWRVGLVHPVGKVTANPINIFTSGIIRATLQLREKNKETLNSETITGTYTGIETRKLFRRAVVNLHLEVRNKTEEFF